MGEILDIQVLGSPIVTVGSKPLEVDTRKAIALLAYLAVERSADREVLASLLWGDSPPERARAALRRTLSSLRTGIGDDFIDADRNRVSLVGDFRCDIWQFDELIESTASHDHDPRDVCSACVDPLQGAVHLYRSDFLGAFYIKNAPDFEDWARSTAEAYRLGAGIALRRLAMANAGSGDYTAAIAAAHRWVELDELHEPAHRLVMLLHAWDGDRPGAMESYRNCVAILDRELGVPPLEETTELFEAILDEDLPPAPGLRKPIRTHVASRPTPNEMIDRFDQAGSLRRAVDESRSHQQLVFLTGDSWMGKTALLEHTVKAASEHGHRSVSAVAFQAEIGLPYGVAVQLLAGLMEVPELSETLPEWVHEELHRLNPRLASGHEPADIGQLGEVRLREAFLTLVEFASSVNPLLLTVDDSQWTDPASATLLAYVVRRISDARLLMVLATRAMDALHSSLRDVAVDADMTVHLLPLTASDIEQEHPGLDTAQILGGTGGIPLLVKEAIDSGGFDPELSTVTRYMDSRRRRLSDLARQVLTAASVLSGMCDPSLLKETSGRTEEEVVEAVEELISVGVLRELEDEKLGFTLDVLESITYESTSLVRRRLLHRRAAEAMKARPRTDTDVRSVMGIAHHLRSAGSPEAAHWYRLAGDLARTVHANEEALGAYDMAIALGHPDVAAIRLALGELAMTRGDYSAATRELRTAASHSSADELAIVEHRIGDLNRILGRFELAEEAYARAENHHPSLTNLYADWALLKHRVGDVKAATEMAVNSKQAAKDARDSSGLARAINILGVVTPDPEAAVKFIDEALSMTVDGPPRMAALNNKAHLAGQAGDAEYALQLVAEALDIAHRTGYRHHEAALLNHKADLLHQAGREDEAHEALTTAVTRFADLVVGEWEPEVWMLRQW